MTADGCKAGADGGIVTQYSFMSYTYPGATSTQVDGINSGGEIAGYYQSADFHDHGFVSSLGISRTVDYPAAYATFINGVNAAGDIVGQYEDSTNFSLHGFVLDASGYKSLDFPKSTSTSAEGINSSGQIVGNYLNDATSNSFFYDGNNFLPRCDRDFHVHHQRHGRDRWGLFHQGRNRPRVHFKQWNSANDRLSGRVIDASVRRK